MNEKLDRVLGWVLIYEGFVLASRLFNPRLRKPPAVSQIVWALPSRARVIASVLVCVKLFHHLVKPVVVESVGVPPFPP